MSQYGGLSRGLESGLNMGLRIQEARANREREAKDDARQSSSDALAREDRARRIEREKEEYALKAAELDRQAAESIAAGLDETPENQAVLEKAGAARQDAIDRQRKTLAKLSGEEAPMSEYERRTQFAAQGMQKLASMSSDDERRAYLKSLKDDEVVDIVGFGSKLDPELFYSDGKTPSASTQATLNMMQAMQAGDLEAAGGFVAPFIRGDVERNIGGDGPEEGTIITSKTPVGFVPDPDDDGQDPDPLLVPVLKVGVRHKTKGDGEYHALTTEDGTAGPGAPKGIRMSHLYARVNDIAELDRLINDDPELQAKFGAGVQAGGGKRFRSLREAYLAAGNKPLTAAEKRKIEKEERKEKLDETKTLTGIDKDKSVIRLNDSRAAATRQGKIGGAGGGPTTLQRNVEYLSTLGLYGGDKKKIAVYLQTAKQNPAKARADAQRLAADLAKGSFDPNFDVNAESERIYGILMSDYESPIGGKKAGGDYEEGRTYTDANGNKAVYQNGEFVEVEDDEE